MELPEIELESTPDGEGPAEPTHSVSGFTLTVSAKQDARLAQGGALAINAGRDVDIDYGGAFAINAGGSADIQFGGAMIINAGGPVNFSYGGGWAINAAKGAELRNSTAVLLISPKTELHEGSRVILNTPQAIALGAAFGAAFAVIRWLLKK